MKKGWQTKSLGDLCDVIGGGTPPKDKPAFYSGEIPWATVRDMRKDVITETEFQITKAAVKSSATNIIPSGNVVIATRVGLGKVCLTGQDTAINQDLRGIVPRSDKALVVRYLYWWLKSIADVIVAEGTGATVQGVKLPFVKSLQIPVPPLAEQQRIVGVLDEAFEGLATAKANAEKNLQNARALFESHLQSVFTQRGKGWVEKLLGDVCETTQGVQIPKNLHFKSPGENRRRYLYISDFDHDENLKYVDDIFPKKRVTENDLIVVNTGATAGKIFRGIDGVLSNNLFKVTLNQGIDADFLYYFVTSSLFKEHQKKIVKGTANPHMGHENFKSTPVNIPPLDVQLETATKLDDLREETQRLARIYERKLAALAELKKSLLHQAFTGEL